MTVAAPAKVNLWLRVGPPRPSGYHHLSTLFCALDLADTVVIRKRSAEDETGLEVAFAPPLEAAPELGPPASNLAVRAAELFLERAGVDEGVHIQLIKRIPAGGGLGGGSSDAGSVLRALRRMYPEALGDSELLEVAASLGSDVPFFLRGIPLALGAGRGERLTSAGALPPRPVVLIIPPFPVSTAEAYGWLDQDRGESGEAQTESQETTHGGEIDLTWEQVAERAQNAFEGPVFARHPELGELRDALREGGARPALLAGSGSTVFGVFRDRETAVGAMGVIRARHPDHRVILTGTRTR